MDTGWRVHFWEISKQIRLTNPISTYLYDPPWNVRSFQSHDSEDPIHPGRKTNDDWKLRISDGRPLKFRKNPLQCQFPNVFCFDSWKSSGVCCCYKDVGPGPWNSQHFATENGCGWDLRNVNFRFFIWLVLYMTADGIHGTCMSTYIDPIKINRSFFRKCAPITPMGTTNWIP